MFGLARQSRWMWVTQRWLRGETHSGAGCLTSVHSRRDCDTVTDGATEHPGLKERGRSWVARHVTVNRLGDLAVLGPNHRSGAGRMESLMWLSFALTPFPVGGILTGCPKGICSGLKIESDRWEEGGVSSLNGGRAQASRRRLSVGAAGRCRSQRRKP